MALVILIIFQQQQNSFAQSDNIFWFSREVTANTVRTAGLCQGQTRLPYTHVVTWGYCVNNTTYTRSGYVHWTKA